MLSELLLRLDLSEVPVDKLATAVKAATTERETLREFIGKATAAMRQQQLTYAAISEQTGIPTSTLQHWERLYS